MRLKVIEIWIFGCLTHPHDLTHPSRVSSCGLGISGEAVGAQECAGLRRCWALVLGLSCKRLVLCRGTSRWAGDPSCLIFSVAAAQGSALALPSMSPSTGQPVPVDLLQLGPGASPMTRTDCASPQSPKGFLESYEEMLNYALRPETWATTRLELEGRGVSWFVLST